MYSVQHNIPCTLLHFCPLHSLTFLIVVCIHEQQVTEF
jgi:ureidoglycolate hydrolase